MADILSLAELLAELQLKGYVADLLNDPTSQFGTDEIPDLANVLMPERLVPENMFKERAIKYKTFVAQAGSYYSPAQLNAVGEIVGEMTVELGKTDQADQVTAQDYKTLMQLLNRKQSREALLATIRWADYHLLRPHLALNRKYIWDALLYAQITRTGSNSYLETVDYPNPPGHRPAPIASGTTAAPAGWYSKTANYDPFEDIFERLDMMSAKGNTVTRIVTGGRKLLSVLGKNPMVRERTSRITIANGEIQAQPGRATTGQINAYLNEEGIPGIEIYNKTYHTRETGERLHIPDNVLLFIANSGQGETIDLGERGVLELENTLGYFAIGTTAQAFLPGRTVNFEEKNLYPSGYYAEAIQMGLPVNLHPENVCTLTVAPPA